MQRYLLLALAATLAAPALVVRVDAQTPTFSDPGNLAGERPEAVTGRELPIDQGTRGLEQMLRRLNTRASLMLIVAHPDDEDGGMLTYVSRGLGGHVGVLTLTRGEGGQNAVTGDFEDALGLLRTQELLSADRYFGVTQMFGTEVDFGFSKTKSEAFAKWGHERVLYDAVRAVRIFRPLVIAAVFSGSVTDGHGQHQVSGEIAQEVFKAAADPNVFPELAREGILPWQPLKVYARVPMQAITDRGLFDYATGQYVPAQFTNYVTGQVSSTPPVVDVTVHEGATDPLLGSYPAKEPFVSYVQFARQGLGLQRSQVGPGMRVPPPGVFDIGYHRYGSMLAGARQKRVEENFFDGIDTSLEGIATLAEQPPLFLTTGLRQMHSLLDTAMYHFDPEKPGSIAPSLAEALSRGDRLIAEVEGSTLPEPARASILHELRVKTTQIDDALALSLGITIDAAASEANLVTGEPVKVTLRAQTTATEAMRIAGSSVTTSQGGQSLPEEDKRAERPFAADHPDQHTLTVPAPETLTITRPYFYRDDVEEPVYKLRIPSLRDAAETPPALVAHVMVDYRGIHVELVRVVHAGNQPVSFVPPASLRLSDHAQVVANEQRSFRVTADVVPRLTLPDSISLGAPGWTAAPPAVLNGLAGVYAFEVTAPPVSKRTMTVLNGKMKLPNGSHITEGFRPVGYGDLPRTNFYTPATDRVVPVELKLPPPDKRRIGYLPGTGDDIPAALGSIGIVPTMLTVADLTAARLSQFDTVVLGVRTYNAHPDLHGAPTQALLEFARSGGNVLVQYQTAEFTAADSPYPLTLGNSAEKVVDETAPVVLLEPSSPLFTTPNTIHPADFDGWIEERGHGFLGSWDAHYTALTETHDPGSEGEHVLPQQPQRGGLVTVQLGKGRWTYCAFALYRQLPEAVPGAFRITVNLLNP
jgi:LmbE family N-acetylglucosaminyl deacetylase